MLGTIDPAIGALKQRWTDYGVAFKPDRRRGQQTGWFS
jgi:hypothetical protein